MPVPVGARLPVPSQTLLAAGFMVLASALFASMHGTVRLVSFEMHPFVIAFFRNLLGFLVLVPLLMRGGIALFKTTRFGTHGIRAVINSASKTRSGLSPS